MEDLTHASHKLAEEIYKQAAAKQQGETKGAQGHQDTTSQEEPKGRKKDEDIIDAEYKEEDDKK